MDKLSPADKKLLLPLLEEKLERVRATTAAPEHKLAVQAYRKELVRLLKKLNPKAKYRYY